MIKFAVDHRDDGSRGVDIAFAGEHRVTLVGTGGKDGRRLTAADIAQDVEVVNIAVVEDAAAGPDIFRGRWRLVVRDGANRMHGADLPGGDGRSGAVEAAVVAPLEADLHGCGGRCFALRQLDRLGEGGGHGLFAECGYAGRQRRPQQRRVPGGCRGDDDAIDPRSEELGRVGHCLDAEFIGEAGGGWGVEIGQDQPIDPVEGPQSPCVEGADPTHPSNRDSHPTSHRA